LQFCAQDCVGHWNKEGAIQVDSPLHAARPVGGKPGLAAFVYLIEHWFQENVV
jgi:hypothetical protein